MIDITSLRAMAAAGATVDVILAAIEADQRVSLEKLTIRRAKDAERQRRNRNIRNGHADSRGPSPVTRTRADMGLSLSSDKETPKEPTDTHIYTTLTSNKVSKKEKKIYLCGDIPEQLPEQALAFSKSQGWDDSVRAHREWQRFRDYQISKNKKHNSLVALMASWRNWVTSPFQAQGPSNGPTGTIGGRISPIAAALEQHTRDIAGSFDECGEVRPPPPRLISNG